MREKEKKRMAVVAIWGVVVSLADGRNEDSVPRQAVVGVLAWLIDWLRGILISF